MLNATRHIPARQLHRGRKLLQRSLLGSLVASLLAAISTVSASAELQVVATVKPIHSLVASVAGDIAAPYLIVQGAATPHGYSLKPSDAAALQRAELIFRISGRFEIFLNTALAQVNSATRVVDLIEAEGVAAVPIRTGAEWSATDGHDHNGHNDQRGHGNGGDAIDQHIWLSPANAEAMVRTIEAALASRAPSHSAKFKRNAETTIARLHRLQADISDRVAPVRARTFLVYHDAFQYFERAFDLSARGAISLGDARAPGARRIRALSNRIKNLGIVCIFTEPQFVPRLARTLAAGTSARIASLDPVGADIPPGPDAYFNLMQRNADSLAECLKPR